MRKVLIRNEHSMDKLKIYYILQLHVALTEFYFPVSGKTVLVTINRKKLEFY